MLNKLRRSNSIVGTRSGSSLASLSDIVHEEDEILHSDNEDEFFILIMISKIGVSQKLIKKRFTKPHGFRLYSSLNIK